MWQGRVSTAGSVQAGATRSVGAPFMAPARLVLGTLSPLGAMNRNATYRPATSASAARSLGTRLPGQDFTDPSEPQLVTDPTYGLVWGAHGGPVPCAAPAGLARFGDTTLLNANRAGLVKHRIHTDT